MSHAQPSASVFVKDDFTIEVKQRSVCTVNKSKVITFSFTHSIALQDSIEKLLCSISHTQKRNIEVVKTLKLTFEEDEENVEI